MNDLIPHKTRIEIVKKHIFPETLSSSRAIWGRELKLLKQLTAGKYERSDFWLSLGLGFQLHSFAWFKTVDGQAELERHWKLFQYALAQESAQSAAREENEGLAAAALFELDTESNSERLSGGDGESSGGLATTGKPAVKRLSPLEWADSPS